MVAAYAYRGQACSHGDTSEKQSYVTSSEFELVQQARSGDRLALGELFSRNEKKMYALALRYSGDSDLARDALQDSYLRVLLCLHQLRADSSFSAWLARIVINSTRLRHRANRRYVAFETESDKKSIFLDLAPGPEQQVAAQQLLAQVDTFLRDNRMSDYSLFVSRFIQCETIKTISLRTGLSIPVIKTRIHRARKYLAARLADQDTLTAHA